MIWVPFVILTILFIEIGREVFLIFRDSSDFNKRFSDTLHRFDKYDDRNIVELSETEYEWLE